jgi:hypothetical protein
LYASTDLWGEGSFRFVTGMNVSWMDCCWDDYSKTMVYLDKK